MVMVAKASVSALASKLAVDAGLPHLVGFQRMSQGPEQPTAAEECHHRECDPYETLSGETLSLLWFLLQRDGRTNGD
jgi:hypothetical protein